MEDEVYMDNLSKFIKAQQEAEKNGEEEFTCPFCGGKAWWGRSSYNNHLHCGCQNCETLIMQ